MAPFNCQLAVFLSLQLCMYSARRTKPAIQSSTAGALGKTRSQKTISNEAGAKDVVRFYHGAKAHFDNIDFCRVMVDIEHLRSGEPLQCGVEISGMSIEDKVDELAQGFYAFPNLCSATDFGHIKFPDEGLSVMVLEMDVEDFKELVSADTEECIHCDAFYASQCRQHLCMDFSSNHGPQSSYVKQMVFRPTPRVVKALRIIGSLRFDAEHLESKFIEPCRENDVISRQLSSGIPIPPEEFMYGDLWEAVSQRGEMKEFGVSWQAVESEAISLECQETLAEYADVCKGRSSEGK